MKRISGIILCQIKIIIDIFHDIHDLHNLHTHFNGHFDPHLHAWCNIFIVIFMVLPIHSCNIRRQVKYCKLSMLSPMSLTFLSNSCQVGTPLKESNTIHSFDELWWHRQVGIDAACGLNYYPNYKFTADTIQIYNSFLVIWMLVVLFYWFASAYWPNWSRKCLLYSNLIPIRKCSGINYFETPPFGSKVFIHISNPINI